MSVSHRLPAMAIPGVPTTMLVAPDSFKGTFSVARGGRRDRPRLRGCRARRRPLSDRRWRRGDALGVGPGARAELRNRRPSPTRSAVRSRRSSRSAEASVCSRWRRRADSGSWPRSDRDALAATTFGTGELILAAIEAGGRGRVRRRGRQRHHRRGRRRDPGDRARRRPAGGAGWWCSATCGRRLRMPPRVFGPQKGADADDVTAADASACRAGVAGSPAIRAACR